MSTASPVVRHLLGRRGDPAVVLVHGIGMSSRYFLPLARSLSASWRVLAVDLPGHGASARPRRALTVPEHAEVVGRVLEQEDVGGALLVGHSMGCQVVAELARHAPATTSGVVLVGPTVDPDARTALAQGQRLLRDSFRETPSYLAVQARAYLACGPRTYLGTLGPMLEHRIEDAVPGVAAPVLVVRGERDPIAPRAWVQRLATAAPHGRTAEIAGAAHGAHHSRPEAVARLCAELVQR